MLPTDHQPLALPSGELSSGCETERVCVAAFARRPWMLLLAVLSMPSPLGGKTPPLRGRWHEVPDEG